ncbi:MAG TPA: allophanate hydrolase subunit 1 [Terrimesophilobacter sp.]|nr:allophanate hydrolase subunit 1 [Terrimesophilobacter sp.]
MRVLPFGDRAILAEYDTLAETMDAFSSLVAVRPRGVRELVPAARTVLARIDPALISLRAAEQWLSTTPSTHAASDMNASLIISVRYDGPDLAETAEILGMSAEELISRHSNAEWRCAFIGFAPGFAYLAGPTGLEVPRRATSRQSVPAGSVGLAGEFTGIYPRSSPGGWQLIGTTDAVLWDETREDPSTIAPGMTVRFEVQP